MITNKPNFDDFRKHMEAAAKAIGVDMEIGNITYGNAEFSFSAKCYSGDEGRAEEFARVAGMKGDFPSYWFGGEFEKGGKKYRISGSRSRARKYYITLTNLGNDEITYCAPAFVRAGKAISENMKPKSITQAGGILV